MGLYVRVHLHTGCTQMATIFKMSDGRHRAQVRVAGMRPRSKIFAKKKDAEAWSKSIESQLKQAASGDLIDVPADATLRQLIELYEEQVEPVKPFGKNKKAVLKATKKKIGAVKLAALGKNIIRDFVDLRVREGAGGVTISIDLSYLRTILSWARYVRNLNVDPDVVLDAKRSLPRRGLKTRSVERTRVAAPEEIELLIEHYSSRKWRGAIDMISLIRFAALTSLRQEEICKIEISDISLKKMVMIVRDRKHPQEKIGNDSDVPVLDSFIELIEKARDGRKSGKLFDYNPRSVSSSFTRACKKLGIKDLHFHDLRHTATTDLFALGLQIPEVALFTGHKDWKMLRRYTHVKPEGVHLTVRRLMALNADAIQQVVSGEDRAQA